VAARTSRRARAAALGLAVVAALASTGCAPGTSPASVVPPTPSVDAFTDALVATRTWAAARADIVLAQVVDGRVRTDRASGSLGLDKGVGTLTWADGRQEAIDHRGPRSRPPGGEWAPGELQALIRPLAGLSGALARAGTDRVGDVEATRFEGSEAITPESLAALGLPDDVSARVLRESGPSDRISLTAWADPYRRLVRLDRRLDTATVQALVTTTLSDFGTFVDLSTPR
jgi:hypothetical protein